MLGRLSPCPCAVYALNWRHHPEKDKEKRERREKGTREAERTACGRVRRVFFFLLGIFRL